MDSSNAFLRLFAALPLSADLLQKLSETRVIQGRIDLHSLCISLRLYPVLITTEELDFLRESIGNTYAFKAVKIEVEEEYDMQLNITSGVIRRAQKVVIYGPEGIGKSSLASKFPGPLFTDTEDGT